MIKVPYWIGVIRGGGKREVRCLQCAKHCVFLISVSDDEPECPDEEYPTVGLCP